VHLVGSIKKVGAKCLFSMYLEVVSNPWFKSRGKRSLARPLKRWHATVTGHVP